jgi:hypothetical protein
MLYAMKLSTSLLVFLLLRVGGGFLFALLLGAYSQVESKDAIFRWSSVGV